MQQTIGKRISSHRKRLGLTQEQLAEKLGVTAQAVSKWENDQSCPDIATLPLLADIFGISVDAILGREQEMTCRVGQTEEESSGIHVSVDEDEPDEFSFHYCNSKRFSFGVALLVLLVGVLQLAAVLLKWEVGFWSILWPSALLVFGLFGLYPKFRFFRLGCALFGGYFLLSNLRLFPFAPNTKILLPVALLLIGASLLADAMKKPQKPKCEVTYHNKKRGRVAYHVAQEHFEMSASFQEADQVVEMQRMSSGRICTSFGDFTVDLTHVQELGQPCRVEANTSFGDLTLLVPSRFMVVPKSNTSFADMSIHGHADAEPAGTLQLEASVSFGQITIRYV